MTEAFDALPTEQPNPRTTDIDLLPTRAILEKLNAEDQQVAPAVERALDEIARAVDLAVDRWRRGGRVVLFGAGSSGRLAMLDAAELGPTFGVPAERYQARMAGGARAMRTAAEGSEDDRGGGAEAAADLRPCDFAFGVAASGRTPWVVGALARARELGAATAALSCVPRPVLARYADVSIEVDTGPEALSGSTRLKAGTAQKLVLNAFSTALMVRLGKVYRNLMVDVQVSNAKLQHRARRLVMLATGADAATAARALGAASGEVKTAIALLRLGVDAAEARARLAGACGSLRRVLGEA